MTSDKDQTTRPKPGEKKPDADRPTTSRQPDYKRPASPDAASGDPTQ